MKFEVSVERHFPHPISEVWKALTTREAISEWLLDAKSFIAEVGHHFELTCINESGHTDRYLCQVLALEPPERMVWSWVLSGDEDRGHTEVEFQLKATDTGTIVTVYHRGDRDPEMLERFKSGWPAKLDRLADLLMNQPDQGRSER